MAVVKVKVCGVTTPEDARMVAEAGADWIGLNFHPASPRSISVERAAEIVAALAESAEAVGVFVDRSPDEIRDIAARAGYARDRALLYVKGGGAFTTEKFNAVCTNNNTGNLSAIQCANPAQAVTTGFSASTNRAGWLVGWGGQFALTQNLSAKAESNYISFGDRNLIASDGSALRVGMHVWEEKIGLDYRFNTGP